jgi:DNA-binding transcriptional MocR family regulator
MEPMNPHDAGHGGPALLAEDPPSPAAEPRPPETALLYLQLALRMADTIAGGALKPGQRLPSVRDSAVQNAVSVSTVVQAYRHLEEHGLVRPRPKAGYFIAPGSRSKAGDLVRKIRHQPAAGKVQAGAQASVAPAAPAALVASFAGYSPDGTAFFDTDHIRVALSRAARLKRKTLAEYTSSVGTPALRDAVALRALHLGCALKGENIVITGGCIQAIGLCLQAVTKPGDLVAVESPTFFGFLDLLESLNLKTLALPTDPRTGVSLPALQLALETQPIRAVLLVPTLSNPLGSVMPLAQKRALARLMAQYRVPLIEDVVFNDLLATDARRKAVKAFDGDGWVMACGSFSKTVAPGIRLGWVEAGRWSAAVARLKRVQGAGTNAVLEYALADLLTQGSYEAHLRRLCAKMKQRLGHARRVIRGSFPEGTRVYDPPSGYTLWVEMPERVDSMALFALCRKQGIIFAPGQLFGASERYRHCLRLSFAGTWGAIEQAAVAEAGRLACTLAAGGRAPSLPEVAEDLQAGFMGADKVTVHDLW